MTETIKYHLRVVPPKAATGTVRAIYRQISNDLLTVPEPFIIHSPVPDLLAGSWSIFRETLEAGEVPRGVKEAIATAVSASNRCPWCVDAHTISLYATGHGTALADLADRERRPSELAPLVRWGRASRLRNNRALTTPPFPMHDAAEYIGTAVTFHYLNRLVNALLIESPLPRSRWQRHVVQRGAALVLRGRMRRPVPSGESLRFLPETEAGVPEDLGWTQTSPPIAEAFARFAAVADAAGARVVPASVRELVCDRLSVWDGADPGMSRAWLADVLRTLDLAFHPAARLLLPVAFASYQIDEAVIAAFRAAHPGDDALVSALVWGAFTTARTIGSWLGLGSG